MIPQRPERSFKAAGGQRLPDTYGCGIAMTELIRTFAQRGDLAHLALFLWATSASALAAFALKELAAASRRFDDFVRELACFNDTFGGH
jgi:hypothetical protein